MPCRLSAVLLCVLALLPVLPASGDEAEAPLLIAATDDAALRAAKGQSVIVRGKAIRTGKSKATGVNFIAFGAGDFTVVTFGRNLHAFAAGEPADLYKDKFIEVRGEVTFYKDKPQIELVTPAQIKMIDEKAVAEASAKKSDPAQAEGPDEETKPAEAALEKPTGVDPKKYFTD